MIRLPFHRLGRGSILVAVGLLIVLVLVRPQIFSGDESAGTRGLPRADRNAQATQPTAAASPTNAAGAAQATPATPAATPPPEALAAFEHLGVRLAANPYEADAWMEVGALLVQANDNARAAEAYAAAAESDPGRAEAHAQLGKALLHQGMVHVARLQFLRAIAIDPALAEVHLNLGVTYSHAAPADIPAARTAWMRAAELAPGSEVARQAGEYLAAYAEPTPAPASVPRG